MLIMEMLLVVLMMVLVRMAYISRTLATLSLCVNSPIHKFSQSKSVNLTSLISLFSSPS